MNIRESAITLSSELSKIELGALKSLLSENPMPGNHLEIGTAAGGTLRELISLYKKPRPHFVVVDPFTYFPNQLELVKKNLSGAGLGEEPVEFRQGYSWPLCAKALAGQERFDFIFIDGHHGYKYVMQDLRWTRMLEVNGFVCLHDYGSRFPGVKWAVDRFLQQHSNYKIVAHEETLVILQKLGAGVPEVSWFDVLLAQIASRRTSFKNSVKKRLNRPANS